MRARSQISQQYFLKSNLRGRDVAGCWWLMPVILATQEVEIRRMEV
jgi:hypothetical protein